MQLVCTAVVAASRGRVTDITEVPSDTVRAQLDHLLATASPAAAIIGVLGNHRIVEAVFNSVVESDRPVLMNVTLSGPQGETLLTERGVDALLERIGAVDLVFLTRRDAELVTGGEIQTLDDAQVAAQRAHKRGIRRVLIKCGNVPARFHTEGVSPGDFMTDLYFDGEEFALFEAPRLDLRGDHGAASTLATATMHALLDGAMPEEALQFGKQFVTDTLRHQKEAHRKEP